MQPIATVLCPVDYSGHARSALQYSLALARLFGSRVRALHVYPKATVVLTEAARQLMSADLRRFVDAEAPGAAPVEIELREGFAAAEIASAANAADVGLVVLGTHGRTGVQHLLLGSVTEKVLRTVVRPVLTVPHDAPAGGDPGPVRLARILCPVDFSDASLQGLDYAVALAHEAGAHLTVLHVLVYEMEPTPDMHDSLIAEGRLTMAAFRQACEERSRRRLDEMLVEARRAAPVDAVLASGTPWRAILRAAGDQRSDLIVMGVHGRGAVSTRFVGSTTSHVVRQAASPVMTLRAPTVR